MLMVSIFHNELIKKEINMLNKNKSTIKNTHNNETKSHHP